VSGFQLAQTLSRGKRKAGDHLRGILPLSCSPEDVTVSLLLAARLMLLVLGLLLELLLLLLLLDLVLLRSPRFLSGIVAVAFDFERSPRAGQFVAHLLEQAAEGGRGGRGRTLVSAGHADQSGAEATAPIVAASGRRNEMSTVILDRAWLFWLGGAALMR